MSVIVACDPALFAFPGNVPATNLEAWISAIADMNAWAKHAALGLALSESAVDALGEEGVYPHYSVLSDALAAANVDVFDAGTASSYIQACLGRLDSLEVVAGIVETTAESSVTAPSIFQPFSPVIESVRWHTLRVCALSGIRLFLLCAVGIAACQFKFTATDVLAVNRKDDIRSVPILEEDLFALKCLEDLRSAVDLGRLIHEEFTCETLRLEIALELLRRGVDPSPLLARQQIHDKFAATVAEHRFGSDVGRYRLIVRACIDAIEDAHVGEPHLLRINRGAESAPRMRNDDVAMRRDIDKEYHLHYWKLPDGTVEFASVVGHNDFSIPS